MSEKIIKSWPEGKYPGYGKLHGKDFGYVETNGTRSNDMAYAIDCEMIGIDRGDHQISFPARVSLVNIHGTTVIDKFIKPPLSNESIWWREEFSGLETNDSRVLYSTTSLADIQREIKKYIKSISIP